jgi:hypothetical protein
VHEAVIIYGLLALLSCNIVGTSAFLLTRTYNLQVLVVRRTFCSSPEYKVFGNRYHIALLVIPFLSYLATAWLISTILGIDFELSTKVSLIPISVVLILGWAFGIAVNGSRRIKALDLAETIYVCYQNEIKAGSCGRHIIDGLIVVVNENDEQHVCFVKNSPKARRKKFPILLDRNTRIL